MSSYKIIGGDRREYGPVSADELRHWINDGRLNAQSLVLAGDAAEWKPLDTFPEFSDALRLRAAPPPASAAAADPTEWANQILAREPELRLGECLRSGVSFFTANAAFVVPAVFITWLLNAVMALLPSVLKHAVHAVSSKPLLDMMMVFLEIVGGILHLLLSGVVMGGLYLACLRRMRGERALVADVFDGFKLCFLQLMLAGAISSLLTQLSFLFCLVPCLYLLVAWKFAPALVADKRLEFWSAMELSRKLVTRVWFQVFVLLTLIFLPLVVLQFVGTFKIGAYFFGTFQEANFDVTRWLPRLPEFFRESVTRYFSWELGTQAALLLCQFFAVGALMRAYENLFGARNS